jgi:hypothetical protein
VPEGHFLLLLIDGDFDIIFKGRQAPLKGYFLILEERIL